MHCTHIAKRPGLLLSASLLALALVAAPLAIDPGAPDLGMAKAWAKDGKGNGGGRGNGNAGGNGHGNGHANGHDKHASAASHGDYDNDGYDDDTAHPSELGALNAAHASETALLNAAPNSRVGRIATYREAALDAIANDPAVAEVQDALDQATEDALADDGIIDAGEQAEIDALENDLEDAMHAAVVNDEESMAALDDAANKPITDRVIDTVNDLLGID